MSTEASNQESRNRLKKAADIVIAVFKDDFEGLDQREKDFVQTFHDILFDINLSTDEGGDGEGRFLSTYEFPTTLGSMQDAMKLYQKNHHILSCLQSWSKYDSPDSLSIKFDGEHSPWKVYVKIDGKSLTYPSYKIQADGTLQLPKLRKGAIVEVNVS